MTRLAVIDLDGVIANNEARFAKAEEAKHQWQALHRVPGTSAILKEYGAPGANDIFWQEAFNPELVALDTLIEGVPEAMDKLYGEYGVIFLSSRPESMRVATVAWLLQHDISVEHPQFGDYLVMKPPSAQYIKTTLWKVITVQMLHRLFQADELCFVDDDLANRQAVLDAYPDGGGFGMVSVYGSLAEAVAAL